jgi:hypothetical protein
MLGKSHVPVFSRSVDLRTRGGVAVRRVDQGGSCSDIGTRCGELLAQSWYAKRREAVCASRSVVASGGRSEMMLGKCRKLLQSLARVTVSGTFC